MSQTLKQEYEEYLKAGRIWGVVPQERIKKLKFPRIDKKIIEEFHGFADLTGPVSDLLEKLGLHSAVAATYLQPIIPGKTVIGTAITLRSIPERKTVTQGLHDKDFIRMASREAYYLAEPGDILVADMGGNLDISNMGGQAAAVAVEQGVAGLVVNGAVRDIGSIKKLNFPVWAKGRTPITGKCRIEAIEVNGPVTLHDIQVIPGDLIIADDSGVCVVPADKVQFVLDEVRQICADEEVMRELIRKKAPISEIKPLFRKRYK
jgi:regulator of RNase E activity RraA